MEKGGYGSSGERESMIRGMSGISGIVGVVGVVGVMGLGI